MDIPLILYIFVCITVSFIIKGLVGFGDPLLYTPLLSVFLPNSTITPGMLPVSLVLNARVVWKNRAHFSPRLVLPIAAFVMLGIIPGTLLLRYGSPSVLKLLLGLVIIAMGAEMLTRKPGTGKPSALLRSVKISDGVQSLVAGLDVTPAFVLAKGGITSSDVGTKALRVRRARVLGQLQPGVPVWRTGPESRFPGTPYVIFPGNTGGPDTLRLAVETLLSP